MYKTILVPLDGSALAEAALPHARTLAHCFGAQLILLSIPIYAVREFAVTDPLLSQSLQELTQSETMNYLLRTSAELKKSAVNVRFEIREGPVAEAIIQCATEVGADLVIMSTHARSGVRRFLLGSVADQVVRGAAVPVLLIRSQANVEASTVPATAVEQAA